MFAQKTLCLGFYFIILTSAYPYYDEKLYERDQHTLPTSDSVIPQISQIPRQSFYNHYYKQQRTDNVPYYFDQRDNPDYNTRGYVESSGFYHYPSHNSKYYGLPTYQGEYVPQPYYYAKSPRYNYYEDSEEPTSNPIDDLQEEIRYEEQKDLEDWYNHKQREAQTNNFLRNLIAYNREMDEEQRMEQENEEFNPREYDYLGMDYDYDSQPKKEKFEYYDLPSIQGISQQQSNNYYYPPNTINKHFETTDDEVKQLDKLMKTNNYNRHDKGDYQNTHANTKYNNYENNAEYDLNDDWIFWERKRKKNNLERSGANSNENIYDTIKQLIALDKALDLKNERGLRNNIKRFTKSEDNLENELGKLKETHKIF
uniref:Uncharacterized protein n=1 Tax=Megaselia scalaris TaxID=36166 RepID=T1GPW5_MEGSC